MANSVAAIDGLNAVRILETLRLNASYSRDEIIDCIVALNSRKKEDLKTVFDFCDGECEFLEMFQAPCKAFFCLHVALEGF